MSKIRVLIVEDEPVIAENISMYLDNNDFEVSAIAYDSAEANEQLKNNTPDAAILDVNLESEEDGIDIAGNINRKYQIWNFFYDTGKRIGISAHELRSALEQKVQQLDPHGTSTALRRMVIIGHSQGGQTVRVLTALLEQGARAESAAASVRPEEATRSAATAVFSQTCTRTSGSPERNSAH